MTVQILIGDVRERLKALPDESVHCVVTSPPYFGLRDYGTAVWEGGEADCGHVERTAAECHASSTLGPKRDGLKPDNAAFRSLERQFRGECRKCGATRADKQIGLEPTPDAFVAELVAVFREVRRVLRKDGVLWLNLGDSYASDTKGQNNNGEGKSTITSGARPHVREAYNDGKGRTARKINHGLKQKDLIGIPWRVAFALQADGWWLRQDIIWSKPNPMPESVTDRCTKAHEYLFLLTKGARYYFDSEAIAEESADLRVGKLLGEVDDKIKMDHGPINDHRTRKGLMREREYATTRNRRSVWEVATQPFSEAHFATFPPALIEPCILAGCPKGGTVLDPFGGAGTTGLVADRLGRNAVLIELNPEYAEMARRRIHKDAGMFAQVAAE